MGVLLSMVKHSATSRFQWYKGVLRLELYQVSRALPQRFEPLPRRRRRMLPAPSQQWIENLFFKQGTGPCFPEGE